MNLIERLIAGFIERSCKHYVTTIIGVISVVLYALSQFGTIIPAQYQSAVSLGSILLSGVALLLAKDSGLPLPTFPAPIAPQPPDQTDLATGKVADTFYCKQVNGGK